MSAKKKTSAKKSVDLTEKLLEFVQMELTPKQLARRTKLQAALNEGIAKYDETYDAYYDQRTGKWLEPKCRDKQCHFCKNRPSKKKL